MESSSEISFTWTDTSNDSIDSHSTAAENSILVEKSFAGDKQTERKLNSNESQMEYDTKVKNKKQLISEQYSNQQKKMVKVEPESDCETQRKKQKYEHVETNGNENELRDSYDESYLDLKVKQEEMSTPSSTRKVKKKRNLNGSVQETDSDTKEYKDSKTSPDSYNQSSNIQVDPEIKRKKKKKKSRKKSESEEERKYSEDIVRSKDIDLQSDTHTSRMEEPSLTENVFDNESCDEISAIQCDDHNVHTLSFTSGKNKGDSLYKSAIINQLKMDKNDEVHVTKERTPRLSDRIRFEDEEAYETEFSHVNKTSSKLKNFIKTTHNMKLISHELPHSSTLTRDDEIWIVHCPKEIDVQGFCGADLNMHGKSKLKVGGQTYDGTEDCEECGTTALLTMENSKYEINNLPLSGIINFRKRIPKAHFRDDNIMVNNQSNFIPLPETKCRHPLFGSNYKKALKIPIAIAQQLNLHNVTEKTSTNERRKKKKYKKDKDILKYEESDSKCDVKAILEPELVLNEYEKKKKKRKHIEDDGPSAKRVKKFKHDPESAEAWDSEKAIEQNLFSF